MRKLLLMSAFVVVYASSAVGSTVLTYAFADATDTITFEAPQQPTPGACAYYGNCFSIYSVPITIDGVTSDGTVSFYDAAADGGLTILENNKLLLNIYGPASSGGLFYTGTLTDPTLINVDNFTVESAWNIGNPTYGNTPTTFSSNVAILPEPAELGLCLLAAAGGLCFFRRRRAN